MYRNVPKNLFQNVGKCTKKTISKVIRVAKGTLDVILSQINKKIGDRFHFQWYRRRVNYQFFNYVTDKVNGSRVQPSLFGEDQRPDPGDGGNRAYPLCGTVQDTYDYMLKKNISLLVNSVKNIANPLNLINNFLKTHSPWCTITALKLIKCKFRAYGLFGYSRNTQALTKL